MLDVVGIADAFSFVTGAGSGAVGAIGVAYGYSKRGAIASLFKRGEAIASTEISAIRQALVNLENQAGKGFSLVSSATKAVQADVAAVKKGVGDVAARIETLEVAVFGAAHGAVQNTANQQASVPGISPAPTQAEVAAVAGIMAAPK